MSELGAALGSKTWIIFALIAYYIVILIYLVLSYILVSLSLYRISARRGIKGAGLAWVPIARNWTMGAIVDKFEADRNNVRRRWRIILILLAVITAAGYVIFAAAILSIVRSAGISGTEPDEVRVLTWTLATILPTAFAYSGFIISRIVCIYKLFESCNRRKAVKYLLIYSLVPFAAPFVLSHCKNMDDEPDSIPQPVIPAECDPVTEG